MAAFWDLSKELHAELESLRQLEGQLGRLREDGQGDQELHALTARVADARHNLAALFNRFEVVAAQTLGKAPACPGPGQPMPCP